MDSLERLTYSVDETCKLLGLSRGSAYEAIRQNQIPSIIIGRRKLIPKAALDRMLAEAGNNQSGHSTGL